MFFYEDYKEKFDDNAGEENDRIVVDENVDEDVEDGNVEGCVNDDVSN